MKYTPNTYKINLPHDGIWYCHTVAKEIMVSVGRRLFQKAFSLLKYISGILDSVMMAAFFNLLAIIAVLVNPRIMMGVAIRSRYRKRPPQPQTKREKTIQLCECFGTLLPLIIYEAFRAVNSKAAGFWNLFYMAYIEWLVIGFMDFFLLDIFLLQKMGHRMQIPDTYGHPDYSLGNWLKKLAIPEHFLGWSFVFAPLMSAAQAGVGMLCGRFI